MPYFILFCILLGIIIQVGIVAVKFWPVSLTLISGFAVWWFKTRITRLPSELPADIRSRSITVSDLVDRLGSAVKKQEAESAAYYSLTSIQQKKSKAPPNMSTVLKNTYTGVLLYIIGRVTNVSSDLTVSIAPDNGQDLFPKGIEVVFPRRWKPALSQLNKEARVQFIGVLKELSVQRSTITNGRILVNVGSGMKWVDDDETYDSSHCKMEGLSIAIVPEPTASSAQPPPPPYSSPAAGSESGEA